MKINNVIQTVYCSHGSLGLTYATGLSAEYFGEGVKYFLRISIIVWVCTITVWRPLADIYLRTVDLVWLALPQKKIQAKQNFTVKHELLFDFCISIYARSDPLFPDSLAAEKNFSMHLSFKQSFFRSELYAVLMILQITA